MIPTSRPSIQQRGTARITKPQAPERASAGGMALSERMVWAVCRLARGAWLLYRLILPLADVLSSIRYPNMDFIVFCGLVRCIVLTIWFSYDIVCQWSRNLVRRVATLPPRMQIDPDILNASKKVLPKFHEFNHGYKCQVQYSLNITRHAGRMNCEDPERWWGYSNATSMSTKEMGEGSREDTLDDFARSYNFRKITGFGM